jgi:hypothetical protein
MKALALLPRGLISATALVLAACGGGGSGGTSVTTEINTQGEIAAGQMMSFADVEPILQARCTGCHNDGDNPLAPFPLATEAQANSFKSAINYTLTAGTMPPDGTAQPTEGERAQLLAWSANEPYREVRERLRVPLVEAQAWDLLVKNRDTFVEHRPQNIDCDKDSGWLAEDGALEVRT